MTVDEGIKERLAGLQRAKGVRVGRDHHHYIALSIQNAWMLEKALPLVRGVVLDYGCGGQPYRQLISSHISRYIGADVAAAQGITLDIEFLPDEPLPLGDGSIDTILSTQTLEHVRDVDHYLGECNRLLKSDGILILTAPMQWRHHETPYDYLRFTRFGLTEYLRRHGFHVREMSSCGGVYALIGQIWLNHLVERRIYSKWLFRLINWTALWLDKKYPDCDDTLNWMCIAQKESGAPRGQAAGLRG